jgi:preprotein translocase subunit SecD
MRRKFLVPLLLILIAAFGGLAATLAVGNSPELGLDLQGGVSVVLAPTGEASGEQLDQALNIIRDRVDALGVAEPEILRQGDSIVVNLPGVADRERALEVIGRTAELRFRPVLGEQPYLTPDQLAAATSTTTTTPGETTTTTSIPPDASSTSTTEGALGAGLVEGELAAAVPTQDTTTTTTPATTSTTVDPAATTSTTAPATGAPANPDDGCALLNGTTPTDQDTPDATVVLPGIDSPDDDDDLPEFCFRLGPVPTDGDKSLVGSIVSGPEAQINQGEWGVSLNIKGDSLDLFNRVSGECYSGAATCPYLQQGRRGQLAIALDGEVQSAPSINEPSFGGQGLTISGSFTERQARDLALVLRFGALPVELEPQTVQTVSATLGEDSLHAGLLAGLIGVVLVAIYMLLYYRALGVVVLLGLALWSAINFSIICWLGETQGLALSLSGVTGIVISVGVTVDSYVVYFERLKDEIRSGKTIRSSVDRGFQRAFRTILAADISSFIGAALLYTLTVGPVRGFAFFLGLSTVLDVVVAYFFTRPLVNQLGRSHFFTTNRTFGVGRGLGMREATL